LTNRAARRKPGRIGSTAGRMCLQQTKGQKMTIAIRMEFDGATLAQYDEVLGKMGLTPGGPGPAGAISHWATATDNGIVITDVWQSREQYEKFAAEQIGPFSKEAGFPGPPQVTFYDVHSYFTPGPGTLPGA
jgi:hypothetical protein